MKLAKEGEVWVRGQNVTKGYLNNPEANESSFTADGSFKTGDQGKPGVAVELAEGETLNAQELKTWVSGKVSKFKVPKKLWFPDEIPKTAMHKRLVAEAIAKT